MDREVFLLVGDDELSLGTVQEVTEAELGNNSVTSQVMQAIQNAVEDLTYDIESDDDTITLTIEVR